MKLLVAGAFEAGSHFAHAINTVKMAEGFARLGHDVSLLCRAPEAGPADEAELARAYGLRRTLAWRQLAPRWLGRELGPQGALALQALPRMLAARPGFVFARHYALPTWSVRLGVPTAVESHGYLESNPPFERLAAAARRPALRVWVTISDTLAEMHARAGVPEAKILVLPNGIDADLFAPPKELPPSPYPPGGPVVTYVGHLYDYKGIPTVLAAAARLPEMQFHLVGGWPEDVERARETARRERLGNVTFHGLVPHGDVPVWMWHADVLLLPPSADHPSAAWTSPVKLGEYLVSGTPVVATSIPALRHWLTKDEVEWVAPDDPGALASGIRRVLDDPERASRIVEWARSRAADFSYEGRARRVLEAAGLS